MQQNFGGPSNGSGPGNSSNQSGGQQHSHSFTSYNPYNLPPSGYSHHATANIQQQQQHSSYTNNSSSLHSQTPNPRERQVQPQAQSQTQPSQPITPAWAKQLEYAAASRMAASPHHHARVAQLEKRGHSSSALSIIDPKDKLSSTSDSSFITSSTNIGPPGLARPGSAVATARSLNHKKTDSLSSDRSKPNSKASNSPSQLSEKETDADSSSWSTLDMGGMSLKNLAPALFAYSFLTALYIPHNTLTTLPTALCKLKHLVRLDASSNKLTSVPVELGTMTTLRELLLFDNLIVNLPPELGTLHLLDVLGVEGNPLQDSLRVIAEKDGTSGLVAFLRDSCPVPMPPVEREWINIDLDEVPTADDIEDKNDGFSVLCYNILCEKYATTSMYGYTPSWALNWEYRKELVLQEVVGYEADVLCLQVSFDTKALRFYLSGPLLLGS